MLTAILIALPFLVSLLCLLAKENSRIFVMGSSIVNLILTCVCYFLFLQNQTALLSLDLAWIPTFGINFSIGIDGVSMVMMILTNLLVPFIILSSYNHQYKSSSSFYALISLMHAGLCGVFLAKDAFLFYVFYELALIPIFFICAFWGGKDRIRITVKFFIYTLAGSLFMLFAIIYLYLKTPLTHTFSIEAFYSLSLTSNEQIFLFLAFFLAFAVKIPIVPFHTWQAETYTSAPAVGTMLLSGIMLKMGLYGLIRLVVPVLHDGVLFWQTTVMALCVIGVLYGAIIAIKQDDLKTLLAFSSLSHVGLIAAGIFSLTDTGMQGAVVQMLNHGISVVALFSLVDMIETRTGTRSIKELSGLASQSKQFAIVFMIILLGAVGLPLTNGFIGEFMLLFSVYQFNAWMGGVTTLTIIFGAVYMLRMYRNIFLGESNINSLNSFTWFEKSSLYILCALVLILGIYPAIITQVSNSSASSLLNFIQQTVVSN